MNALYAYAVLVSVCTCVAACLLGHVRVCMFCTRMQYCKCMCVRVSQHAYLGMYVYVCFVRVCSISKCMCVRASQHAYLGM